MTFFQCEINMTLTQKVVFSDAEFIKFCLGHAPDEDAECETCGTALPPTILLREQAEVEASPKDCVSILTGASSSVSALTLSPSNNAPVAPDVPKYQVSIPFGPSSSVWSFKRSL